ncbi:DUF3563 family protein [Paraburkholderia sp.]|uniref:DUF3563 family protein n=1 Tax=Paraburkholderia sp. TaxID=1926495 RepID=UPI003C794782
MPTLRYRRPSFDSPARCQARHAHLLPERIMFRYFVEKLSCWFERTEQRRANDFLASSSDIAELERRMRSMESTGSPT